MPCRLAVLVVALLTPQFAPAAEVDDLYFAQAIVTGTEEPERTRGFRLALIDMVVKLTGDIRLEQDPRVQALAAQPHRFVERFEYEDRMKDIPVHDEQGTRERPHFLRVVFEERNVDAELRRLNLRKWGPDRPMTAIWLGIHTARDRYVLSSAGADGYAQRAVLMEGAARRGLPIRLPPAGQSEVGFDQVARSDIDVLEAASSEADALLVGTLSIVAGGYWDIDWTLRHGTGAERWKLNAVSFDRALNDGLETAALILSGNAAPR